MLVIGVSSEDCEYVFLTIFVAPKQPLSKLVLSHEQYLTDLQCNGDRPCRSCHSVGKDQMCGYEYNDIRGPYLSGHGHRQSPDPFATRSDHDPSNPYCYKASGLAVGRFACRKCRENGLKVKLQIHVFEVEDNN